MVPLSAPPTLWPISITKLAEEMGVSERALTDAARSGHLKAWRIGGSKRGELVTTSEALREYYEGQPVVPVAAPAPVVNLMDRALATAEAKRAKAVARATRRVAA